MSQKVYLVDGSGYIFRAFYAVAPLKTRDGFPTNALYGYTRMLMKLLSQSDSRHVVVVFDAGRQTFRNELYSEYKANRSECPEDLLEQMPYFREISSALGLRIMEQPGYEADDIIGTLAARLSSAGVECVVVSADKDLMQLVSDNVRMWDSMRDKWYGAKEVKEKMGVPPSQVTELLGITGDSSDNVPGLKGAGPKTAVQLIEKYGTVENIIKSAALIAGDTEIRNRRKLSEQIESDAELIRLSRQLVEVNKNVPVDIHLSGNGPDDKNFKEGDPQVNIQDVSDSDLYAALERRAPDTEKLNHLVETFEFTSLLKELNLNLPEKTEELEAGLSYLTILKKDFGGWLEEFLSQDSFALDLETNSLDINKAAIVGVSFCWSDDRAFYLPFLHGTDPLAAEQVSFSEFVNACAGHLADSRVRKIGQNMKFDIEVLARHEITVEGAAFDTMLAAYLLNPDRRYYNLTALSADYLGRKVIEYDEVVGDKPDFSHVEIGPATRYACQDAHYAWLLHGKLAVLIESGELTRVFSEIEMPLVPVLARMELKGVKIDREFLAVMSQEFAEQLEALKVELYTLAGCEFNLNSPKQLADILFNKLGISQKGLKKTKTGVSTDSSVLEKLSAEHPLPALILRHRTLHKLKSTYIDALPAQISEVTGRLHARFNQTITGTGRLSSSDPNLQNIPIQTAEGRKIRRAFIAGKGRILISADYSQIELRLLAHMSGDENMIRAFAEGVDIHSRTAREIMNLSSDEHVTPDQRRMGKTINFGVVYGMSGFRLGRELGIPVSVANQYIENYFNNFPKVRELFSSIEHDAVNAGHVTTIFGRKRVISDIDTSGRDQGFAMRAAINAPIQGSAADIIKLAMNGLDRRIREDRLPLDMIMQIHDELVFECDESFADQAVPFITQTMESVCELKVPLKVEAGRGYNWEEAHS